MRSSVLRTRVSYMMYANYVRESDICDARVISYFTADYVYLSYRAYFVLFFFIRCAPVLTVSAVCTISLCQAVHASLLHRLPLDDRAD